MSEHLEKSIALASKISRKAEDVLSRLDAEMNVMKWPPELRAVMWDAITAIRAKEALETDCKRMEHALRLIMELDQRERHTAVEIDPAGNTYAIELIDGPCAAIAREALNQQFPKTEE